MATDYISRESVLDIFHRIEIIIGRATGKTFTFSKIIDEIKEIPAADVRPVKIGHYVTDEMGDSSCSECGEKYLDITKRFCPECGAELRRSADMREATP